MTTNDENGGGRGEAAAIDDDAAANDHGGGGVVVDDGERARREALVSGFVAAVNGARDRLKKLEPNPDRAWKGNALADAKAIVDEIRRGVLAPLTDAVEAIRKDDADSARVVQDVALRNVIDAAGLAVACGDVEPGRRMLRDAKHAAAGSPLAAEITACLDATPAFAHLTHGRWLLGAQKYYRGERALKRALRAANADLSPIIKNVLTGPRPVGTMPSLYTFNGIGGMFFGSRDRWPDSSYVTTHFLAFFFVPLIPMAAYRVVRDAGGYRVLARYPLGRLARAWLAAVGAGALLVAGGVGVAVVQSSDFVAARRAVASADALEAKGDLRGAAGALSELLRRPRVELNRETAPIAQRLLALRERSIKHPLDDSNASQVLAVVHEVDALSPAAKAAVIADVDTKAAAWLKELAEDGASLDTQLAFARAARKAHDTPAWRDAVADLEMKAALDGADAWPADAAHRLMAIVEKGHGAKARAALAELLVAAPTAGALEDVEREARAVAGDEAVDDHAKSTIAALLAKLDARRATPAWKAFGAGPDAKSARAVLASAPDAQGPLAVAVEDQLAAADDGAGTASAKALAAAHELLAHGPPRGWWGAALLDAGAAVALRSGDLVAADELLSRALAPRVKALEAAQVELDAAGKALIDRVYADANANRLPAATMEKLRNAGDDEQQRILQDIIRSDSERDARLQKARADMEKYAPAVSQSLQLGTIKLRRAAGAKDEAAEKRMLAEAEQTFLSISRAASDDPTYQLGLGEVKYRTHQADEGKKLLDQAVARGDASIAVDVASIYRNVGEVDAARATARKVFDGASKGAPERVSAASLLAVMERDVDEQIKLLEECAPAKNPAIRARLAGAHAEKLLEEGKEQDADRELAIATAFWDKQAAIDPSAANNGAVAWLRRYEVSGDIADVEHARAMLARSRALDPNDAVSAENLFMLTMQQDALGILAPALDLKALRPDAGEAGWLVAFAERGAARGKKSLAQQARAAFGSQKIERLADELRALQPTSPHPVARLAAIYEQRGDADALAHLEGLVRQTKFDVSDDTAAHAKARAPAERKRDALLDLERIDKRRGRDPSTNGALEALRVAALSKLGAAEQSEQRYVDALAAADRAEALWPALDLRSRRVGILLQLGALRAAAGDAAVKSALPELLDDAGGMSALLPLLVGKHTDLRATLAARPEWTEALALAKASMLPDDDPSLRLFSLATLLHDDSAARQNHAALEGVHAQQLRIEAALAPYDGEDQAAVAMIARFGGGGAQE